MDAKHVRSARLVLWVVVLAIRLGAQQPRAITVDYPADAAIFPSDFAPPTFLWRDNSAAARWVVEVSFPDGSPAIRVAARGERPQVGEIDARAVGPTNELPKLSPQQASERTWQPEASLWESIKKTGAGGTVTVKFTGYAAASSAAVSSGRVAISISRDPVGAPIFYRDVPLMPSETEKGVIKPLSPRAVPLIAWRLRNVGDTKSKVLMTGIHSCANCHSFSADGKTMGMDVDGPQNDKGLYAIVPVGREMKITQENIVAWSTFNGKLGGKIRVGFMSQVSPDGSYVATTINDPGKGQSDSARRKFPQDLVMNYYVANFKDYRFLQVFYPTRGIIAWYARSSGTLTPLPGADDPRYVHTDAVWSPDGKYLVFARAEARDAYSRGTKLAERANDPNETPIRYDLYRIPFEQGRGGTAEPVAGASNNRMSNSFPKVSPDGRWIVYVQARNGQLMRPDSQLYIVPASGGQARRMKCNTPLMNSWHSFSPNSRWLVFSSKSRSPYTQLFLTHIDEEGNDSPAILIENTTAANRAANIPEFVNIAADGMEKIAAPVTEYYSVVDTASQMMDTSQFAAAIPELTHAQQLNPTEAGVANTLGIALLKTGKAAEAVNEYEKAVRLDPEFVEAYDNLGNALAQLGKGAEAIANFEKAVELDPSNYKAHSNMAVVLGRMGRLDEAIDHLERALLIHPDDAEIETNLGLSLAMQGRFDEAITQLKKAVASSPDFQSEFAFGRVLMANSRFAEAISCFEKASQLSHEQDIATLDFLGAAYAETGRLKEGIAMASRALELAKKGNDPALVETLQSRIAYYQSQMSPRK